jgi:cation transport ATPase
MAHLVSKGVKAVDSPDPKEQKHMNADSQQNRRERISQAAIRSAIVGPLVSQIAVGFLARLQNFFCPINFLPIYAVSFALLAPGFFMIGWAGADMALRIEAKETPRWMLWLALAAGGALAGVVYFEALAFLIRMLFTDYGILLNMPGLRPAISAPAALAANWSLLFRPREPQRLSLRQLDTS